MEVTTRFVPATINHKKKSRSHPEWDSFKIILDDDEIRKTATIYNWCIETFGDFTEWGVGSTLVWYEQNRWYWDAERWYFKNTNDMVRFKFFLTTLGK